MNCLCYILQFKDSLFCKSSETSHNSEHQSCESKGSVDRSQSSAERSCGIITAQQHQEAEEPYNEL